MSVCQHTISSISFHGFPRKRCQWNLRSNDIHPAQPGSTFALPCRPVEGENTFSIPFIGNEGFCHAFYLRVLKLSHICPTFLAETEGFLGKPWDRIYQITYCYVKVFMRFRESTGKIKKGTTNPQVGGSNPYRRAILSRGYGISRGPLVVGL